MPEQNAFELAPACARCGGKGSVASEGKRPRPDFAQPCSDEQLARIQADHEHGRMNLRRLGRRAQNGFVLVGAGLDAEEFQRHLRVERLAFHADLLVLDVNLEMGEFSRRGLRGRRSKSTAATPSTIAPP